MLAMVDRSIMNLHDHCLRAAMTKANLSLLQPQQFQRLNGEVPKLNVPYVTFYYINGYYQLDRLCAKSFPLRFLRS